MALEWRDDASAITGAMMGTGKDAGEPAAVLYNSRYSYPKGVGLFAQEDVLQEVLQLVSGLVKLTYADSDGNVSIIDVVGEGAWLGIASVIAMEPSPVGAVTCSNAVLRRVPAATFRQRLHDEFELLREVLLAQSRELCRRTVWAAEMTASSSLQRLQSALWRLAREKDIVRHGREIRLQLPICYWELAEYIGVRPEHLSRLLRELEAKRLLRRDRGWIVMYDQPASSAS